MKPWQKLTDLFKVGEVRAEMTKKYKNTVLGVTSPNGTISYGWFKGITDNDLYLFSDSHDNPVKLAEDTLCDVFIPLVTRGLYNTTNGVVFVSRNPYRQYRRGLSKDSFLVGSLSEMINFQRMNSNYFDSTIFQILNPVPDMSLTEFVNQDIVGSTYALNRQFAVSLNHTESSADLVLWYENALIGFIYVQDKRICITNQIFLQEVLDTRHGWCPDFMVV